MKHLWIILLWAALSLCGCAKHHHNYGTGGGGAPVTSFTYQYQWNCAWDGTTRQDAIRVYLANKSSCPTMIFHRGRGFDYTSYNTVMSGLASQGIVCVSVSDEFSFASESNPFMAHPQYDYIVPADGMLSASYAQQEALNQAIQLNHDTSSPLYGNIDESNIYFAGHSRGGGATSYLQSRNVVANGFVYYMAFNLPMYLGVSLPPLDSTKSLVFAATLDGNLGYLSTSNIIGLMTGPTQLITIQGGTHDYMGDTESWNGQGTITRNDEQNILITDTASFIK